MEPKFIESENNEARLNVLSDQLKNGGVDTSSWGTGESKTIADLQKEIDEGETVLVSREDKIIRQLTAAGAHVFYLDPQGRKWRLKENKQKFADGRERQRNFEWAVSEKIKASENSKEGIIRGLREELGLQGEIDISATESNIKTGESKSYPGLMTEYTNNMFKANLTDEQFKNEGYTEVQDRLSTYFVWEEVK